MTDIFKFWSQIGAKETMHPADAPIFSRLKGKHAFDLRCLPLNFSGPLQNARVVLLYLSPGLSKHDATFAKTSAGQRFYSEQRTGRAALPNDPSSLGYEWRRSRLRFLGDWESALDRIAVMNIGAYHSKTFTDHDVLAALPSSRKALDWAQNVLFPEAEAGKRVVICMRAAKYWGLRAGNVYGRSLFAPTAGRSGHMLKGAMRERIEKAARSALVP
ncbi:hypothetical protein [Bradyrhizobium sp. WU425]|uniref:hypothetical protein n=1 Tax=Bradyrhizobium sp. WU425 TaxID=187029 RepID=UPI001E56E019|nr:hypothetical protein [Bradyrhizobium canariense]UFW69203.1 hypothetical protein BcanWU425_20775 [Bradyrhizobium canariense]